MNNFTQVLCSLYLENVFSYCYDLSCTRHHQTDRQELYFIVANSRPLLCCTALLCCPAIKGAGRGMFADLVWRKGVNSAGKSEKV